MRPLGGGGQRPRCLNRMQQKKKQHIIFVFFLVKGIAFSCGVQNLP